MVVEFPCEVFGLLEEHGQLPLPPYIERPEGDSRHDRERYQTIYAREEGAIAAPTAGLHFTERVMEKLEERGILTASLTLHVGWVPFAPVRVDRARRNRVASRAFLDPEEHRRARGQREDPW